MEHEYRYTPSHSVEHTTIVFDEDAVSEICSMDDFYLATGIKPMIQDGSTVSDVDQIWMNKEQCGRLEDIIEKNVRASKKYKSWSDKAIRVAVAMDWLNYSPVSIPYVPKGEIWIFQKDDAKVAISEYREWSKEAKEA